jgi:hypothetical protein
VRAISRIAASVVALAPLVGCSPATRCTVENQSKSTLTHLLISGSRFSVSAPDLAPGHSCVVTVRPRGEEGTLSVSFRANGREYQHSEPTYFEASGYEVSVKVNAQFLVTAQVGLWRATPASVTSAPPKGAS